MGASSPLHPTPATWWRVTPTTSRTFLFATPAWGDRVAARPRRSGCRSANGISTGGDLRPPRIISADGRFVAFESLATNLVPGDTNFSQDVFCSRHLRGGTGGLHALDYPGIGGPALAPKSTSAVSLLPSALMMGASSPLHPAPTTW